jgi:hypothetical protein
MGAGKDVDGVPERQYQLICNVRVEPTDAIGTAELVVPRLRMLVAHGPPTVAAITDREEDSA